ncbi:hypothetical protein [Micromonospora sp. NPDC004704]
MTLPRHRTARERQAAASAAQAHITPPPAEDDDTRLGALYPYVTAARARAIRHELETRRDH